MTEFVQHLDMSVKFLFSIIIEVFVICIYFTAA